MALRNPLVIVAGATAEMPAGDAIPATKGGTGASSFTVGDIFYADTTTTLAKLAVSATTYQMLRSNGAGAAPSWAAVYLTSSSATSGVLPVSRGGTGATTLTGLVKGDGTNAMTAAEAGTDYQEALVSGTNIKTVGGVSLLGSGDIVAGGVSIQEFVSSGTWTKPATGTYAEVELWSAGAGGAAGYRATAGGGPYGGGGGGGGAKITKTFLLSDLAASISVSIGAGGTGIAGITVDSTKSADGQNGGNTTFGTLLTAFGGTGGSGNEGSGGGGGGAISANAAGTFWGGQPNSQKVAAEHSDTGGGNGGQGQGNPYHGTASVFGGGGGGGVASNLSVAGNGGESVFGGSGGGAGGAINASSVRSAGGAGGSQTTFPNGGGGALGAVGANGGAGNAFCGGGGGGAGTTTGGNGGNGGIAGGGGGGGASLNGYTSGAGGNGGNGYARIIVY